MSGVREQRSARIRALADEGKTRNEVADEMGLTYQSVVKYGLAYGIKFRRKSGSGERAPDEARIEAMAAMYSGGRTLADIGRLYGVSRERVRQIITKHRGLRGKDGGAAALAAAKRTARDAKARVACLRNKGCSIEQFKKLQALGRALMATGVSREKTPTNAFTRQKASAKQRGIEWKLTLWQWWQIWEASGKFDKRGRERGGYVMCRFGDTGAYEVGNIYIATNSHNCSVQPNNPYRKSHPDHASVMEARAA